MESFIFLLPFWVMISIVLATVGAKREIGGFTAFIISLFFSPLAGVILVAFSKDKRDEAYKQELLDNSEKIISLLQNVDQNKMNIDEL